MNKMLLLKNIGLSLTIKTKEEIPKFYGRIKPNVKCMVSGGLETTNILNWHELNK